MHRLLPVLPRALAALGMAPERDASRVATSALALEGAPAMAIDGTERRRQRPTNAAQQQEQDSGKKKTHTDTNILLVNDHSTKVVSLGPTVAGKKHDKQAADEGEMASPTNATLDKDTGFQGDEPAGVLMQQPKKTPRPGVERRRQVPHSPHLPCTRGRRKRHCRGETVSDCQRCLAPDESRYV
jgi:DDE superfamily endonuclease